MREIKIDLKRNIESISFLYWIILILLSILILHITINKERRREIDAGEGSSIEVENGNVMLFQWSNISWSAPAFLSPK